VVNQSHNGSRISGEAMHDRLPEWLTGHSLCPGNGTAFNELREVVHARHNPRQPRVICFAGAGCSMPLLPGWDKLLSEMRDSALERVRLREQRKALEALAPPDSEPGKYLGFAEGLKRNTDAPDFFRSLKERLTIPLHQRAFTRTHAAIACLEVDGVVTTNFDSCLKQAQQRRFQLDPRLEEVRSINRVKLVLIPRHAIILRPG
jgi:hypothetical protein